MKYYKEVLENNLIKVVFGGISIFDIQDFLKRKRYVIKKFGYIKKYHIIQNKPIMRI